MFALLVESDAPRFMPSSYTKAVLARKVGLPRRIIGSARRRDEPTRRPHDAPKSIPPRPALPGDLHPGDHLRPDLGRSPKPTTDGDTETVRILGIDTPEIRHEAHNIPFDQPFGREATGFAKGALAAGVKVELLRAAMIDPYERTLGYLFINDRNYSVMILRAGLAAETVSHYGDNGLPEEAAACLEAAKQSGPVPFEPPYQFRGRMREVSTWMRAHGQLPSPEE
jgi:endonuclease YncB( thermonuclease family)